MDFGIKFCEYEKGEIYTAMYLASRQGTYTSYLRGARCRTETDFFHEISASLQFPFYFGENWAAMDEFLCDLEWLNFQKMLIVVDDFGQMFSERPELKGKLQELVVKYLRLMAEYWESQNKTVEIWLNH